MGDSRAGIEVAVMRKARLEGGLLFAVSLEQEAKAISHDSNRLLLTLSPERICQRGNAIGHLENLKSMQA